MKFTMKTLLSCSLLASSQALLSSAYAEDFWEKREKIAEKLKTEQENCEENPSSECKTVTASKEVIDWIAECETKSRAGSERQRCYQEKMDSNAKTEAGRAIRDLHSEGFIALRPLMRVLQAECHVRPSAYEQLSCKLEKIQETLSLIDRTLSKHRVDAAGLMKWLKANKNPDNKKVIEGILAPCKNNIKCLVKEMKQLKKELTFSFARFSEVQWHLSNFSVLERYCYQSFEIKIENCFGADKKLKEACEREKQKCLPSGTLEKLLVKEKDFFDGRDKKYAFNPKVVRPIQKKSAPALAAHTPEDLRKKLGVYELQLGSFLRPPAACTSKEAVPPTNLSKSKNGDIDSIPVEKKDFFGQTIPESQGGLGKKGKEFFKVSQTLLSGTKMDQIDPQYYALMLRERAVRKAVDLGVGLFGDSFRKFHLNVEGTACEKNPMLKQAINGSRAAGIVDRDNAAYRERLALSRERIKAYCTIQRELKKPKPRFEFCQPGKTIKSMPQLPQACAVFGFDQAGGADKLYKVINGEYNEKKWNEELAETQVLISASIQDDLRSYPELLADSDVSQSVCDEDSKNAFHASFNNVFQNDGKLAKWVQQKHDQMKKEAAQMVRKLCTNSTDPAVGVSDMQLHESRGELIPWELRSHYRGKLTNAMECLETALIEKDYWKEKAVFAGTFAGCMAASIGVTVMSANPGAGALAGTACFGLAPVVAHDYLYVPPAKSELAWKRSCYQLSGGSLCSEKSMHAAKGKIDALFNQMLVEIALGIAMQEGIALLKPGTSLLSQVRQHMQHADAAAMAGLMRKADAMVDPHKLIELHRALQRAGVNGKLTGEGIEEVNRILYEMAGGQTGLVKETVETQIDDLLTLRDIVKKGMKGQGKKEIQHLKTKLGSVTDSSGKRIYTNLDAIQDPNALIDLQMLEIALSRLEQTPNGALRAEALRKEINERLVDGRLDLQGQLKRIFGQEVKNPMDELALSVPARLENSTAMSQASQALKRAYPELGALEQSEAALAALRHYEGALIGPSRTLHSLDGSAYKANDIRKTVQQGLRELNPSDPQLVKKIGVLYQNAIREQDKRYLFKLRGSDGKLVYPELQTLEGPHLDEMVDLFARAEREMGKKGWDDSTKRTIRLQLGEKLRDCK